MFLKQPSCFVIVKNLKRNHQDKKIFILAHKGIFYPVA